MKRNWFKELGLEKVALSAAQVGERLMQAAQQHGPGFRGFGQFVGIPAIPGIPEEMIKANPFRKMEGMRRMGNIAGADRYAKAVNEAIGMARNQVAPPRAPTGQLALPAPAGTPAPAASRIIDAKYKILPQQAEKIPWAEAISKGTPIKATKGMHWMAKYFPKGSGKYALLGSLLPLGLMLASKMFSGGGSPEQLPIWARMQGGWNPPQAD